MSYMWRDPPHGPGNAYGLTAAFFHVHFLQEDGRTASDHTIMSFSVEMTSTGNCTSPVSDITRLRSKLTLVDGHRAVLRVAASEACDLGHSNESGKHDVDHAEAW